MRWRRGLKQLERVSPTQFRETTRDGTILFEVVEEVPEQRRITRIADDKLPFGGRWIYELAPDGAGTRLTCSPRRPRSSASSRISTPTSERAPLLTD